MNWLHKMQAGKAQGYRHSCICFLQLLNKLPQMEQLKTTQIHYLMVSEGQESRRGITEFSASGSQQAVIRELAWSAVSSEAQLVENLFPSSLILLANSSPCNLGLKLPSAPTDQQLPAAWVSTSWKLASSQLTRKRDSRATLLARQSYIT